MNALGEIKALLEQKGGFKLEALSPAVLDRLIEEASRDFQCEDLQAYLERLSSDSSYLKDLLFRAISHETWFFRHHHSLEAAAEWAVRYKQQGKPLPVRILSAGCSSGEEPYSLAMLLLDKGIKAQDFVLLGADFNPSLLEQARSGRYPSHSFRGVYPHLVQRYFHSVGKLLQIDSALLPLVRFVQGDLLDETTWKGFARFHLIFCRHLLIYLSGPSRQTLMHQIGKWLLPEGLLFVAASEVIPFVRYGFQPYGAKKALCLQKTMEGRS